MSEFGVMRIIEKTRIEGSLHERGSIESTPGNGRESDSRSHLLRPPLLLPRYGKYTNFPQRDFPDVK